MENVRMRITLSTWRQCVLLLAQKMKKKMGSQNQKEISIDLKLTATEKVMKENRIVKDQAAKMKKPQKIDPKTGTNKAETAKPLKTMPVQMSNVTNGLQKENVTMKPIRNIWR
jgi:hypothetical protein